MPIEVAQVIRSTSETEAIDGKASPRNPKVEMKNKLNSLPKLKASTIIVNEMEKIVK